MDTVSSSQPDSTGRIEQARALFPFLKSGTIFMNHASVSPQSTRIVEVLHRYLQERSSGKIETYLRDLAVIIECKKRLCRLINAESEDRIALTMNTSDALNIVAGGIRWKKGDRILLNDLEFPANVYPFLNLRRQGVEIDVLPGNDGMVTADRLISRISTRTRVVALSAVQFLSGYRADLATIGAECRRRGVIFVVDGIQAAGAIRIDVQECRIDAFAAGAQKWLMGPQGIGMLYITEQLQDEMDQASVGWLAVENPWDFSNLGQPLAATARRFEGGTLNVPGVYAFNESLSVILEIGVNEIEEHVLDLTDRLSSLLPDRTGLNLYSPRQRNHRAGIVTVDLPAGRNHDILQKQLLDARLVISLRNGKLRYAPHFYNTIDEVDRAVDLSAEAVAGAEKR